MEIPQEFTLVSTKDTVEIYAEKQHPKRSSSSFSWYFRGPEKQVLCIIQSILDEYPPAGYGTSFQLLEKDEIVDLVLYKGWRAASC
jgi:hypothetical protein